MIMNLWSTPVAIYDLKPYFDDFDASTREMVASFPERSVESNHFYFEGNQPFSEANALITRHLKMYSTETGLNQDLAHFGGFFNSHEVGQVNAPHAHPLALVVAVYYVRALGKGHGDILLHDPRGGISWKNVVDKDSRGIGGYRIFERITPESGQLIIFPGYLIHSVEPNLLTDQPTRMSIGINCFSRDFAKYLTKNVR